MRRLNPNYFKTQHIKPLKQEEQHIKPLKQEEKFKLEVLDKIWDNAVNGIKERFEISQNLNDKFNDI